MFGINGGELLILIVVAIIVVGPERMPEYAKQLREWVVSLRAVVDRGREQIKEEVGEDVDWNQLDPRQYDPRRIVREALNEPTQTGAASGTTTAATASAGAATAATATAGAAAAGATSTEAPASTAGSSRSPLLPSAPFDSEAT